MESLQEKIVLITGAAGGFGRALAEAFRAEGAHLALIDRDEPGLAAVAADMLARGGRVQTVVADLSTTQGVEDSIATVLTPFHGQVDVLVSNVGVLVAGPFAEMSDAQIEQGGTMNFRTHVWAARAVLPIMAHREGATIIFVGSDQGSQPDSGFFPYAQAKAALHSLTKELAREYGPTIRVNAIAPGMSRTPLVEGLMARLAREDFHTTVAEAERLELHRRGVPLGRLGEPQEVASAAVFLAQNGFCTGSILDLSGGNRRGL